MNTKLLVPGQKVKVCPTNGKGLLANEKYMQNRRGERPGVITQPFDPVAVPLGHAAAWVTHDDDHTLAPYWYHELEARR